MEIPAADPPLAAVITISSKSSSRFFKGWENAFTSSNQTIGKMSLQTTTLYWLKIHCFITIASAADFLKHFSFSINWQFKAKLNVNQYQGVKGLMTFKFWIWLGGGGWYMPKFCKILRAMNNRNHFKEMKKLFAHQLVDQ